MFCNFQILCEDSETPTARPIVMMTILRDYNIVFWLLQDVANQDRIMCSKVLPKIPLSA